MGRYRWGWYLVAGAPALIPLILIFRYGVNFHYYDEWAPDMAGVLIKAHSGQLTLGDIFAQHNEHRPALTRLIWVAMDPITHWNNISNLIVSWLVVVGTSFLMGLLIRKSQVRGGLVVWFLCNLLLFSPAQNENWLWGIGLANFLPGFFFLAAILAARSRQGMAVRLAACLGLAGLATVSLGSGLLVWPLAGLLLLWPREDALGVKEVGERSARAGRVWAGLVWVAAWAGMMALYYRGYERPTFDMNPYDRTFWTICDWTLAFMGSWFPQLQGPGVFWGRMIVGGAIGFGAVAAGFYFVVKLRMLDERMLPWLAVAAYGIASGLIAAFFRAGFGSSQAVSSRYVTPAVYIPIGLINLIALMGPGRMCRFAKGGLGLALVISQILIFPAAMEEGRSRELIFRLGKGALLLINIVPDNPQSQYFGHYTAQGLVGTANALDAIGDLQPPLLTSNDAGRIARKNDGGRRDVAGAIDGSTRLSATQVGARGWAIFPKLGRAATCVFLTYVGANGRPIIFGAAEMRFRRDDLADIIPEGDLRFCGWQATLNTGEIPASIHSTFIEAWVLDEETGRATPLDRPVRFER